MNRTVAMIAVLSCAGCLCSGPPKGECSGTWGGVVYDKAQIDPESRLLITASGSCLTANLKTYELSWKSKAIAAKFSYRVGGPSSLSPRDIAVPPLPDTFETYVLTPEVSGATGNIHLVIVGLQGRRAGSIDLTAGTESLSCSFEVPYQKEGSNPSCGGSGGADFD